MLQQVFITQQKLRKSLLNLLNGLNVLYQALCSLQEGFEYLRILLTLDNFVCSIPFMHIVQYDNITAAHFPEWFLFALSNPTLQLCDTCIGIATC